MKIALHGDGAETWAAALAGEPGVQVAIAGDGEGRTHEMEDAEVLMGWRFPESLLRLPKLRWIQLISVGAHDLVASPHLGSGVTITNTKGIYADSVADYMVWALLTLSRGLHRVILNQRRRRWRQVTAGGVSGKTLVVVGLGHIGAALAVRAQALGMRVVGVSRTAGAPVPEGIDRVVPFEAFGELLPACDALAICAPLTARTRGMVDGPAIARLKPGAIVVNVSPAELLDVQAVVGALRTGALAGAALDVFSQEPLSRWSRLWSVPNLLVTPHVSAITTDYRPRVARLMRENLRRFQQGAPLLNVVDRTNGY
ncbi:MAG: D-2-hydroxyacid dehydrogenase [Nitrospiria bacterium]